MLRGVSSSSRWRSYRDVDAAADPQALGAYMDDLAAIGAVAAEKARSLQLLGLGPGGACLDVGCGTGPDVAGLAGIVGAGGRVVGVDRSEALAAAARSRAGTGTGTARSRAEAGTAAVEFVVGDAHRLPFADAAFDACRADRTLQHVTEPAAALAEMVRVTRPGGRVVVTEFRWGLVAPGLDRTATEAVLRAMAGPGERRDWLGHRLVDMVTAAGLADARAVSSDHMLESFEELAALLNLAWSIPAAVRSQGLPAERATAWEQSLRSLAGQGEAFAALVIQHVVGTRR
jgi:SAM-dependent methyltransferase